jgi:L-amino acid N-acyltransferase YncA
MGKGRSTMNVADKKWTHAGHHLSARILSASDAPVFQAIRLRALETEGKFFTASYEEEKNRTTQEWTDACIESTQKVVLGAFRDTKICGCAAAEQWEYDPEHTTVKWTSAYVDPDYRRMGIGKNLNILRNDWSIMNGYTSAIFTIRADNNWNIKIHERNGAVRIGEQPMRFADGSMALALWYQQKLTS